jgi:hypothetical protein
MYSCSIGIIGLQFLVRDDSEEWLYSNLFNCHCTLEVWSRRIAASGGPRARFSASSPNPFRHSFSSSTKISSKHHINMAKSKKRKPHASSHLHHPYARPSVSSKHGHQKDLEKRKCSNKSAAAQSKQVKVKKSGNGNWNQKQNGKVKLPFDVKGRVLCVGEGTDDSYVATFDF